MREYFRFSGCCKNCIEAKTPVGCVRGPDPFTADLPGIIPRGDVPNVYCGGQVILSRDVIILVTMPEELIQLLTKWHTVPVATSGPDGKPNVAGKSVMVMDPQTIVWGELYFGQTYENLKRDPRASLCVWKRTFPTRAYKVNGRVLIHENDEIAARLDERVRAWHKKAFKACRDNLAAVYFTVEEIYDQTPDPGAAGKRIG